MSGNNIIVDYKSKTKNMCKEMGISGDDINSLVMFFNYCFTKKNNFFVQNFNKTMIKNVYNIYNKIKTNIFTESKNLYENLETSDMKLLKFILSNFYVNYKNINDEVIKKIVTDTQMKNISLNIYENIKEVQ